MDLATEQTTGGDSTARGSQDSLRRLGDYTLERQIGCGGMGVVYEARQLSLNRLVALKMVRAEADSPTTRKRFLIETEAAAKLKHPHIVPIYETGEEEAQAFFSMALIEGESLRDKIKANEFVLSRPAQGSKKTTLQRQQRRIASLLASLAHAVHYAHEQGVFHRDLKPGNVLIDREDQPHLTDFGLAKINSDALDAPGLSSSISQPGLVLGTAEYMSPEQASGRMLSLTSDLIATDIYSLGVILYELLTGEPPFREHTIADTLRRVREDAPSPPRRRNPRVDKDLQTICLKCLEKNPRQRYHTAGALAEDLERWMDHRPIQARKVGPLLQTGRWIQRNPLGTAFIATLFLGLGIALFLLDVVNRQKEYQADLIEAMVYDSLASLADVYRDPDTRQITVPSSWLDLLEGENPVPPASSDLFFNFGISMSAGRLVLPEEYAQLLVSLRKEMSGLLDKTVTLNLKLYKDPILSSRVGSPNRSLFLPHFMRLGPVDYLTAEDHYPNIRALLFDNNRIDRGILFVRADSGITNVRQLIGKRLALPDSNHPHSIMAKAHLAEQGIRAADLSYCTNFNNNVYDIATTSTSKEPLYAVINGHFDAGVITELAFTRYRNRRQGLRKLDSFPGFPSVYVACTNNLDDRFIETFKQACRNIGDRKEIVIAEEVDYVFDPVPISGFDFTPLREALEIGVPLFDGQEVPANVNTVAAETAPASSGRGRQAPPP